MNTDNYDEMIDWNEDNILDQKLIMDPNIPATFNPEELKCYEAYDSVSVGSDNSDEYHDKQELDSSTNILTIESTKDSKEPKKIPNKELIRINKTLKKLSQAIDKYVDDIKTLWEELMCPFILSEDCMILERMPEWIYMSFYKYMEEQRVYKLMMIAHKRLLNRRDHILSEECKAIIKDVTSL